MDSVNRQIVIQRISRVYDTLAGAQGTYKHIKDYTKALRNSVGLADEAARTGIDFIKDFGGGL